MNLMKKRFYTLKIMEWKTFFQECGIEDLYAKPYAKLFEGKSTVYIFEFKGIYDIQYLNSGRYFSYY